MKIKQQIKPISQDFDFSRVPSWYVLCTDNDCNSYGKLTLVPKVNITDGAMLKYLLDEELQASF